MILRGKIHSSYQEGIQIVKLWEEKVGVIWIIADNGFSVRREYHQSQSQSRNYPHLAGLSG